jgi:hypothetical protein
MHTCRSLCLSVVVLLLWLFFPLVGAAQTAKPSPQDIYQMAANSVVSIEAHNDAEGRSELASGFVLTSEGAILTNYHAIRGMTRAVVRMPNLDAYDDVQVTAADRVRDLALIKIKAVNLVPLRLGRSAPIQIGETVYVLSNPLHNFRDTLAQGIVSGRRQCEGYHTLQFSAAISKGSSGGPLLNGNGEVVGVVAGFKAGEQNLNLAIPIDYAAAIFNENLPRSMDAFYQREMKDLSFKVGRFDYSSRQTDACGVDRASLHADANPPLASIEDLQAEINLWTSEDAAQELGTATGHRFVVFGNEVTGDIFAYRDPTNRFREIELNFDNVSKRLAGVYLYPKDVTWPEYKRTLAGKPKSSKKPDGSRLYTCEDSRVAVLVAPDGEVKKLTFW